MWPRPHRAWANLADLGLFLCAERSLACGFGARVLDASLVYTELIFWKRKHREHIELLRQQSYFANCFCMKKETIINCMLSFVLEMTQTIKES